MNIKNVLTLIGVILIVVLLVISVVFGLKKLNSLVPKEETEQTTVVDKESVSNVQSDVTTETKPSPEAETTTTSPEVTTEPSVSVTIDTTTNTSSEPQTDLPPNITITPDDNTAENVGIKLPCEIEGYGLVIEKIAVYNGLYVEDGTNATLDSVAMLLVSNNGDYPIEYTQLSVMFGEESLLFDITALPKGERLVVQEKTGKTIPDCEVDSITAMVVQRASIDMSEEKVSVIDNGNNTLTVKNLTQETIPTIRVFYKYYMKEENIFVGGISFTVRLTQLGAGESITIQPSHFTSETSKVVMVLTYDAEV